jgi:hypothetical protein
MNRPLVLLDCSGSMYEVRPEGRRIDLLRTVLTYVLPNFPSARLVAFGSIAQDISEPSGLPESTLGSTAVHRALAHIAPLRPELLVVISDGEPDNAGAALMEARRSRCPKIATYFTGDEKNRKAVEFLQQLARCSTGGAGEAVIADLRHPEKLAQALQKVLLLGRG